QPVRRFGVDAAILFSDILLPLVPMGLELGFVAGEGPVIANPVRTEAEVAALRPVEPREALRPVLDTIRALRAELPPSVPLIGFVGGPFTVASYAIAGGPSRDAFDARRLMHTAPALWHALMTRLVAVLGEHLAAPAEAGAQAVQLFDSWAGALSEAEYRRFVLPYSRAVLERVGQGGVPRIHFAVGASHLLPAIATLPVEVVGLDWRTTLREGRRIVGPRRALQGNLDPVALFAPANDLRRAVDAVLAEADGGAHIFNVGHGIHPGTPIDAVQAVVDRVHERPAPEGR
ncbi:MAG TPA: uroporphyrinogen decarboxylase, partial [Anaeromyxobacteraceae bacterium]|nr:uroporphyrinogen decarboxylase [Anaeromyxobacteraceae bacterium]